MSEAGSFPPGVHLIHVGDTSQHNETREQKLNFLIYSL